MKEPNISAWRRSTFGDLISAFRFRDARANPPVLPDTAGILFAARYSAANLPQPLLPGNSQELPR